MEETPVWRKGGLVRRGFALVVDVVLVMLLTQSLAVLLFPLSGGAVIDSSAFVLACQDAPVRPTGLTVPPGFEQGAGRLCQRQFVGNPTAHVYKLTRNEPGSVVNVTVSYWLDSEGRPVQPFDLATLQWPLVALLRWWLDIRGHGSPGRHLLGLRVEPLRSPDGEGLSRAALDKRYLLFALPCLVPVLMGLALLALPRLGMAAQGDLVSVVTALARQPLLVAGFAAVIAVACGRDAYYDAAAGTTVVRLVAGLREVEPNPAGVQSVLFDRDAWRRALRAPLPIAALALAFVLALVFAAELWATGRVSDGLGVSASVIVVFGGKSAELVWQAGQWHRLVTAMFLHWSAAHLVANLVPLLIAGWLVEPLIGARWFMAAFLLGGLAGSLASVGFNSPFLISAGASGSVFAVIAAGLVVSLKVGDGPRRLLLQAFGLASLILLGTGGMLSLGRIDQADHLGGAVGGAMVGLAMLALWRRPAPRPRWGAVAAGLAIVLAGATFLSVPKSGFGDVALTRLLIPADQLPKNDTEWVARADELVGRYPRDPRAHLARALAAKSDEAVRERELSLVVATQEALSAAELPRVSQNAFALVGEERRKARDFETARALFDRALATSAAPVAGIFAARAYTNLALGRLDQALADRQAQMRLEPNSARTLFLLAGVLSTMGREDEAIQRLDEALALDKDYVEPLRHRGWLSFLAGKSDLGIRDLERALVLRPSDAFTALWLHIASMRSGHGGRIEAASEKVELTAWPGPLVRFYRGEIDERELRRAADQGDAATRNEQTCEADFYLAQWHLIRSEPQTADPLLRRAVSFCPKTFYEWDFARAERRRISS